MSVFLSKEMGRLNTRAAARVLQVSTVALIAAVTLCSSASAATSAEMKARGYMSVATEDDYTPFEFVSDGEEV